jgi:GNAT superfamily N-acetyltransferase
MVSVRNECPDFKGYRAARVKSLFNVASGASFSLDADLPLDEPGWKIGVVVGPSGSGKSSIGRMAWGGGKEYRPDWPGGEPVVEAIARGGDFNAVTGALAAVGLGDVPAWLRPYAVLSNGERYRCDLARVIADAPAQVVLDEFSSVVDRQIAKVGAAAFAKSWRRTGGQALLLTCHYDVLDWLEPDWAFDTATGKVARGPLWRRPPIGLDIFRTDWRYWAEFEPHHYLKLPIMPASCCYVGAVGGERVAHVGMGTRALGRKAVEARACRLVIKPEWQGAGVGLRFLNWVCQLQLDGGEGARLPGRRLTTLFHTSHPGLAAALRRSKPWRQVSAVLYGGNKRKSAASIRRAGSSIGSGYGGHFRAVQGFRYYGAAAC